MWATEVWKRVENDDLEQQVLRVMKPMFLRVEGLSVADMYAADKVYEKLMFLRNIPEE